MTDTKSIEICHKDSRMIIGIMCRTSNDENKASVDIPKLWNKFFTENIINKIPNKLSVDVLAFYYDYESDHTKPYSLLIGCVVDSIDIVPKDMIYKIIPAGSYAVFHASGEQPSATLKCWQNIWNTDLKRTYTGDYELYSCSKPPTEVDIFIAI